MPTKLLMNGLKMPTKSKENRKLELLDKLQQKALNRVQVKEVMFCVQQTADDYIAELRAEKRIYVAFWHRTTGKPSPYFLAGNSFDAERPIALSRAELTYNHEQRKARGESDIRPRTHFINNQHLITRCFASMISNANVSPTIKLTD